MTPSEFKSWFEGFTEGLEGRPSEKQWERIRKRVSEIDGTPVAPIYVERYRDSWRPYYWVNRYPVMYPTNSVPLSASTWTWTMNAGDAMFYAGKSDAAEVASSA